jgi:hypothetical protein
LELAGEEIGTDIACTFLLKWPTLECLQHTKPETIRAFFYAHHSRSEKLIQARLNMIEDAVALTTDPAVVEPYALLVQTLATQIRTLNKSIAQYDQRIAHTFAAHEDAFIFKSFPGAGDVFAPRLLAAFGADRERYASAADIQTYSGIAPVLERSGTRTWVHWRWHRPVFMCQTFYEYAQKSLNYSPWAMAYYRMLRANGKGPHATMRALAFKWQRILFRCWQDRVPYEEGRYIAALKKHGAALLKHLAREESEPIAGTI